MPIVYGKSSPGTRARGRHGRQNVRHSGCSWWSDPALAVDLTRGGAGRKLGRPYVSILGVNVTVNEQQAEIPTDLCSPGRAIELYLAEDVRRSDRRYLATYNKLGRRLRNYDGLYSEAEVLLARRLVDAAETARQWTEKHPDHPLSAVGVRAAARRGDIPSAQVKPGGMMLFDPEAVFKKGDASAGFASGYEPNQQRGEAETGVCSNPRCKRGEDGKRATITLSAYERRNYVSHFCCWDCKYQAAAAWNPGGGRKGVRSTSWMPTFLDGIAQGSSIAEAAKAAGISKATAYRHRARDERFRAKWQARLPEVSARSRYWADHNRSGAHRAKLPNSSTYAQRLQRQIKPPLERALRSPDLSKKREQRKLDARRERREEIAAALRAAPSRSNRDIARDLQRDVRLVGIIRRQLENAGQIQIRLWGGRRQSDYPAYPHAELSTKSI